MDRSEQIYQLVEQWCRALDSLNANEALRQIALLTNCIPHVPKQLSDQENQRVMHWLQVHYPNVYLWAMSQRWIGHPAMVWGTVSVPRGTAPAPKR